MSGMTIDTARISRILERAKERSATALLETEGLEILEAIGISAPAHLFFHNASQAAAADLSVFSGLKVVLKVISPHILHKSDVGGVAVVPNRRDAIVAAIETMERKFSGSEVAGFTVSQFVDYDPALGNELLLGARWTEDFGPVVLFGPGGIYTEFLSRNFRAGKDVSILSAILPEDEIEGMLQRPAVTQLITRSMRGQPPRISAGRLCEATARFMRFAAEFMPDDIAECEINPVVLAEGKLVALDVLVKLAETREAAQASRPIRKIQNLLEPRSAAIIGVSEKLNPGHIILNNLIREGFDRDRILVVKPGLEKIEGCCCFPDVASLPRSVDLFVLAVDASQAPGVIAGIIEERKAESIILIPGGLEEKQGTETIVSRMHRALNEARKTEWQGPVINGGNCLGITSRPGRYDTMFIPEHKLPVPKIPVSPVAVLSQSGAFAVANASKLSSINPKYTITLGNQMDLTLGDYLTYLKEDPEVDVFAAYVEGFRPLDGKVFLDAAGEITSGGRTVILYRAGRTAAGTRAAASHTASIGGDYAVTQQLAEAAGVVLAETIADFEDLLRLFVFLRGKELRGRRLGAVSNAGFECVSMADNLGELQLSEFTPRTAGRLRQIFNASRIDQVVDIHNPIDLTPMTGDSAYADTVLAVMEDENVDLGIVGCVPLTAALNTLPRGDGHPDDILREDSIVRRLIRLKAELAKPWVAVVDSGSLYDPMARCLEEGGIPTFRTADRALRLLNTFCNAAVESGQRRRTTAESGPRG